VCCESAAREHHRTPVEGCDTRNTNKRTPMLRLSDDGDQRRNRRRAAGAQRSDAALIAEDSCPDRVIAAMTLFRGAPA